MPNSGDPNIVPTVALGSEPLGEPPVVQPEPAAATPEPQPAVPAEPTAEKLILGKFKSADDLAKAYAEIESSHSRKAQEASELRKQNELLAKAVEMAQKQPVQDQKQTGRDFNAEMRMVQQQMANGQISQEEALNLVSQITEDRTLARARQEYQNFDSERQTKAAEQQFLRNNPDFNEVLQSGALNQILQDNPLYTNLNAYQEYKAQQKLAALQAEKDAAARDAFEKGKAEVQKLAEGSKVAETVISKPGTEMRNEKPAKTFNDREIKAGMLNRLNQMRGG